MKVESPTALVIGAGFAGLSTAISLADKGYDVCIVEKHDQVGGRARLLQAEGFKFDMGPSWYWMPEIIEGFFNKFDRSVHSYLDLVRLDPSYQVIFGDEDVVRVPAGYEELKAVFESIEPGSGANLDRFINEAGYKYGAGMGKFVHQPGISVKEYLKKDLLRSALRLDLFTSFSKHIRKYFRHPKLLQIMEFPVLFLGAAPDRIPALYSLMNYADVRLGTWYPKGGINRLILAMRSLAAEMGIEVKLNTCVTGMRVAEGLITGVETNCGEISADLVVAAADYHHVESKLLPPTYRTYSDKYWDKRKMAPSCLIYYVGVNKKLPRLLHHNLFFEHDFREHAASIYHEASWPDEPLFYVCCPSKTDLDVAPEGMENLFLLIPTAPGLQDTDEVRNRYFDKLIKRMEQFCGEPFADKIIFKKSYAYTDFVNDYNAFKGNAYGLANTLGQTGILKPSIRSKKINNLFYAGQLTVPGPGVPPAIISGQVVAEFIDKNFQPSIHESFV